MITLSVYVKFTVGVNVIDGFGLGATAVWSPLYQSLSVAVVELQQHIDELIGCLLHQ